MILLEDLDRAAEIALAIESDGGRAVQPDDDLPSVDVVVTDRGAVDADAPLVVVGGDAGDEAAALLPADAPAELVAAAARLIAAGYRIRPADDDAEFGDGHDDAGAGDEAEPVQEGEEPPVLSPRELEVLALLAEGAPNKVIARRLDISVHTAKFHVASIIAKLNAANRTDATAIAMRLGLVLL